MNKKHHVLINKIAPISFLALTHSFTHSSVAVRSLADETKKKRVEWMCCWEWKWVKKSFQSPLTVETMSIDLIRSEGFGRYYSFLVFCFEYIFPHFSLSLFISQLCVNACDEWTTCQIKKKGKIFEFLFKFYLCALFGNGSMTQRKWMAEREREKEREIRERIREKQTIQCVLFYSLFFTKNNNILFWI